MISFLLFVFLTNISIIFFKVHLLLDVFFEISLRSEKNIYLDYSPEYACNISEELYEGNYQSISIKLPVVYHFKGNILVDNSTAKYDGELVEGFTLIYSSKPNRVKLLKRTVSLWSQPIIISIYCEYHLYDGLHKWIFENHFPERVEFVVFVVESNSWNHNTYPMNYLRNIAIKRTRTTHYMVLDMDEWIIPSMEVEIMKIPKSILNNPLNVIVLPMVIMNDVMITKSCCSFDDCLKINTDLIPRTMSMLHNCYSSGYCQFKRGLNLYTHSYTNENWLYSISRLNRTTTKLLCARDRFQEPYYIVKNSKITPLYYEKLHTYFRNKVSHMNTLILKNFSFHLLLHTYLVDIAHPASKMKQYAAKNMMKDMVKIYDDYIQSLNISLDSINNLPLCKESENMYSENYFLVFYKTIIIILGVINLYVKTITVDYCMRCYQHPILNTPSSNMKHRNDSIPYIGDSIIEDYGNFSILYVIINYLNLPQNRSYYRHSNYTLIIGNAFIQNVMNYSPIHSDKYPITYNSFQVAKYIIPNMGYQFNKYSLYDMTYDINYDEIINVHIPSISRKGIAICTYVSPYNSYYELRSWILYNKMLGVDNIIIYSVHDISFKSNILSFIQSGFVIWHSFEWPVNRYYEKEQRSVQHIQINSCFYRYRHQFEYIVNIDIDEYIICDANPFDIHSSIRSLFLQYKYNTLIIPSYMYKNEENVSREDSLMKGTIFDVYNCKLDNKRTGRSKLILKTNQEPYISIHNCLKCNEKKLSQSDVYIMHIKNVVPDDIPFSCKRSFNKLSSKFKQLLNSYNDLQL